MQKILSSHFNANKETRAMVFSDYRDSVAEIVASLADYAPNIRASAFIGQASTSAAKGISFHCQT